MKYSCCLYQLGSTICTWPENLKEYLPSNAVQLTEYVTFDFPELPHETLIQRQLDDCDKAEAAIRDVFSLRLDEVAKRRKSLLAIPNLSEQTSTGESR